MLKKQRGVSLSGLIMGAFLLIILAVLGMKLVPAVLEYETIVKAVNGIASEGHTSVADIRKAFDRYSAIDDITAITPADLDISKDGNQYVIAFSYRKEVPLSKTMGIYFNFAGSSSGNASP